MSLSLKTVEPSWRPLLTHALAQMSPDYLAGLEQDQNWLPGKAKLFNAFSIPLEQTQYILFGESPYPRGQSANGYAFWDAVVDGLWSESGLHKHVNRATSLRNFIKMLLLAEGKLGSDTSQASIAAIDKSQLVSTLDELFISLLAHGFLLLNASLVLSPQGVNQDAKAWQPFIKTLLGELAQAKPDIRLLLFGKVAQRIEPLCPKSLPCLVAEHPYNLSFIRNPHVLGFFHPLHLLVKV